MSNIGPGAGGVVRKLSRVGEFFVKTISMKSTLKGTQLVDGVLVTRNTFNLNI